MTRPAVSTPVTPAPAATVVLLRPGPGGPEVLLTHRPTTMAFAAGMHVFPGGRVDPADGDLGLLARSARGQRDAATALGDNVKPSDAIALHMAAIRELFEEAGVLLADGALDGEDLAARRTRLLGGMGLADVLEGVDLRLRTDLLAPIAHWTTPPFMPRRFSTWFFAADLPPDGEVSFEGDEVIAHRWVSPATALQQLSTGEIEMWVPTSSVLQRLVATRAANAAELGERFVPGATLPPKILEEGSEIVRFEFGAVGAVPGRRRAALAEDRDLAAGGDRLRLQAGRRDLGWTVACRAVGPAHRCRPGGPAMLPDAGPVRPQRGGRRRPQPDPQPGGVTPPLTRPRPRAGRIRAAPA